MVLLRTSYRHGGFLEFHFKLQFSAFWSIHGKTFHEKMLILRYILPPKKINHPQKKINPHPMIKLERPDKKLYSLGIILIHYENLKSLEKYQPSPLQQFFFNSIE